MEETITPIYKVGDVLIPVNPTQSDKRMMVINLETIGQEQEDGGVKWRVEYDLLVFENGKIHTMRHVTERILNSAVKMIWHREPADIFYANGFDGGVCRAESETEKARKSMYEDFADKLQEAGEELYDWRDEDLNDLVVRAYRCIHHTNKIPKDILKRMHLIMNQHILNEAWKQVEDDINKCGILEDMSPEVDDFADFLNQEVSLATGIPKDILLGGEQLNKSSQPEPTPINKEAFKKALTKSVVELYSLGNAIRSGLFDALADVAADCINASDALKALAKFDPQL